jgi:hypothetical protein
VERSPRARRARRRPNRSGWRATCGWSLPHGPTLIGASPTARRHCVRRGSWSSRTRCRWRALSGAACAGAAARRRRDQGRGRAVDGGLDRATTRSSST